MIKTWNQRCQEHPDHQTGMVSHHMIALRMQEEIDDLRAALAQPEPDSLMQDGIEDRETRGLSTWLSTRLDDYRAWKPEPEQEPEPVAWMRRIYLPGDDWDAYDFSANQYGEFQIPLYTAPLQRKPLTEEEIEYLAPVSFTWRDMVTFARMIEHEHGIGGES